MNKGTSKIIDLIYWGAINIGAIFLDIQMLSQAQMQESIAKETLINIISGIICTHVIMMIVATFILFPLSIGYIAVKIARRSHRKDKLGKVDYKNTNYYRDLIPKYSIATLSYIHNFSLDEKDIVATLLSLEMKKKIKIGDEIIIIDASNDNLTNNEKFIFNELKQNNLKFVDRFAFEMEVVKDGVESGVLELASTTKKKKLKFFIKNIIIYLIIIGLYNGLQEVVPLLNELPKNMISNTLFIIIAGPIGILVMFYPVVIVVSLIMYIFLKAINPYNRTKEGKQLNKMLIGLNKYIQEFSVMDERNKDDIALWGDYLIYSVIFGINTKIVDEVMAKIK